MMKIALVASLAILGSGTVFGAVTNVCTGGTPGTANVAAATPKLFIQQDFVARCSNNVYLSYDEDAAKLGVAASSKKGKSMFSGGSGGGAVTGATCTTIPCDASQTSTAATAAYTATSS